MAAQYMELTTMKGKKPIWQVLVDNWQPAATVAMVSVPLSISLGIASVAGDDPAAPTMGVATAFWGGISAGLFGSSDHNIVGPAGALSGMLKSYTIRFNGSGVLPYISLISAVFVALTWLLNLQRYMLLMPKAVFEGFTFAVAIIIGLNQLNMAFNLKPEGPVHEHFYENVIESLKVLDTASAVPTIFFLVTAAILLGLVKYFPKIRGYPIPWTVLIPLITMIFGYLSDTDNFGGLELPTLKTKYGELEARVVELPEKSLSYYADGDIGGVISAAFGVAFVAVLETLISAKIAENKTGWGFNDGRETLGLITSHVLCGIAGAMPPTGVFVRTALNFSLGATHRLSQVLNALIVLLISVVIMPVFSHLPQSAVAALLIFAAVRMAPITYICMLWRCDKGSFALLNVTMLICVFLDPVYGLIAGMVVALLRDAADTATADTRMTMERVAAPKAEADKQDAKSKDPDAHPSELTAVENKVAPVSDTTRATLGFDDANKLSGGTPPLSCIWGQLRILMQGADAEAKVTGAAGETDVCGGVVLYEPVGPVVYLAADRHIARIKALLAQKPACIVVSLELASRVDMDGCEALAKCVQLCKDADIPVEFVVPAPMASSGPIGQVAWLAELRKSGKVHEHRSQASQPGGKELTDAEKGSSKEIQEKLAAGDVALAVAQVNNQAVVSV